MSKFKLLTHDLTEFIKRSPSCYHVIVNLGFMLKKKGFIELMEENEWNLQEGGKYFVIRADSSIIAFKVPTAKYTNYQIIASHSDSPTFKIKENEEMDACGHYVELNVEKYGGMLCAPWFDRPLSVAGKVVVNHAGVLETKLVNIDRDLCMLPSLAIHMDRQANEGHAYKIQKEMIPIYGDETSKGTFMNMVAKAVGVKREDILGSDLFLYNRSAASVWGANEEFFSAPKLDDLQCAFAAVNAFLTSENDKSVSVFCVFDNEEVGSGTKQGADSTFLQDVLERINECMERTPQQYKMAVAGSFMISADNGHAVHPNYADKADPTNHPFLNQGPVIKYNANQKYTTDSVSAAIFKTICEKARVPYQTYVNNSDVAGGSTLGNISNAHVSLNTVDVGLAQLGMHSPYETGGVKDTWYMAEAIKMFYQTTISRDERGNYHLS